MLSLRAAAILSIIPGPTETILANIAPFCILWAIKFHKILKVRINNARFGV
jgi:hypothetical protein